MENITGSLHQDGSDRLNKGNLIMQERKEITVIRDIFVLVGEGPGTLEK